MTQEQEHVTASVEIIYNTRDVLFGAEATEDVGGCVTADNFVDWAERMLWYADNVLVPFRKAEAGEAVMEYELNQDAIDQQIYALRDGGLSLAAIAARMDTTEWRVRRALARRSPLADSPLAGGSDIETGTH